MTTPAHAAVVRQAGGPLVIESVEIEDPRPGEVLIRMVGVGVCHTDMVMRDQLIPVPLPAVLGHEGSGIVAQVGEGVTRLAPGDHVVLSFDSCGHCPSCADDAPSYCFEFGARNFGGSRPDGSTAITGRDGPIHANIFGQSSFASHVIAHERNTVKVTGDVPLELLGPLGCGIQTGAGAVLNALKVRRGASIVIFGAGAVGLSAVMAARIAGAGAIVAVDRLPHRLDLARELGATRVIGADEDVAAILRVEFPHGIDYAFDTTGIAAVIETAVGLLAPRGICGLVGASAANATITLNETHLMGAGRQVRGIAEGDSDPQIFIPELIEHYRAGRFPFDRLVTYYDFDDIETAFRASEDGVAIKPILRFATEARAAGVAAQG